MGDRGMGDGKGITCGGTAALLISPTPDPLSPSPAPPHVPSDPAGTTVPVRMCGRLDSGGGIEARERDVDFAGPAAGLEEERRAAAAAEAARRRGSGMVARERLGTGLQHEARLARPDPGDEAGALGAPAHRAMAMGDPERRQADAVAHRAAQATALDAPVRHTTRTFLNCQGSVSSRSSWNIRLRSASGCHSVYSPTTRPRYGRHISRMRW